jgi:hypothetical protein
MLRSPAVPVSRLQRLPQTSGVVQRASVVLEVIADEGLDEVVAVIVPGVAAQLELLAGVPARSLEEVRVELLGEELVVQTLVDEDRGAAPARSDQLACVVGLPPRPVVAEVTAEGLVPQGHWHGAQIGAKADTER